jgi:hypothetical protein
MRALATTRTAAEVRADIARHVAGWAQATTSASLLRSALRTVQAELLAIDAAVDAEEDGAEALWAHRPTVAAHRLRLAGLLLDAERAERAQLEYLRGYGVRHAATEG